MRYERKYRAENLSPEVVRQAVRLHPASFRKIFPDRQINNIYFDTANLVAYNENVDGIAERRKFRVRWYGKDICTIQKPKLEIKIKNNMLGAKETYPAIDFSLHDLKPLAQSITEHSQLKLSFIPTLINSYQRSYYGTANGDFRITIDSNLRYFSPLSSRMFTRYNIYDDATVLELKYEEDKDELAEEILQHIPFRYSKSSKYVTGMNLTVG
ncbi:MAG: SPX domain protein involved in polyphosphate accumulation [Saprospiraceae bacterium]|jgi:SPX domain protein involved in polyphosphate accumulation